MLAPFHALLWKETSIPRSLATVCAEEMQGLEVHPKSFRQACPPPSAPL
jgi:hypothetical protein